MSDDKILWDENDSIAPLRRPFVADVNTNTLHGDDGKSSLNAFAKEWFPPDYKQNNTKGRSVQDRLQRNRSQPDIPMAMTTNEDALCYNADEDNYDQRESLQQLEEIMSNLVVDPGHFDNLLDSFLEILDPYYNDVSFVAYIAESIVGKALNEQNFRYSAARLCHIVQDQCPYFRTALSILCEKKVKTENDFNLSLLLAELYYVHLNSPIYGALVIKSLQNTLSCGDQSSVKAVCQVLKLTGSALEVENKEAINAIFKKLMTSGESQALPVKNLIDSVVTLRSLNWGQMENNINNSNNRYQNEEQVYTDGPIFYGPDGIQLTEEECQFLNENCSNQSEILTDASDADFATEFDPEMDEEMQAAFDQFLLLKK
ncbi:hypothetical protein FQA39_LY01923 [Lamprigera yunnana]|nr:hypothetical protein FQA39_LY01923 [Lamprigera yunnana]